MLLAPPTSRVPGGRKYCPCRNPRVIVVSPRLGGNRGRQPSRKGSEPRTGSPRRAVETLSLSLFCEGVCRGPVLLCRQLFLPTSRQARRWARVAVRGDPTRPGQMRDARIFPSASFGALAESESESALFVGRGALFLSRSSRWQLVKSSLPGFSTRSPCLPFSLRGSDRSRTRSEALARVGALLGRLGHPLAPLALAPATGSRV